MLKEGSGRKTGNGAGGRLAALVRAAFQRRKINPRVPSTTKIGKILKGKQSCVRGKKGFQNAMLVWSPNKILEYPKKGVRDVQKMRRY